MNQPPIVNEPGVGRLQIWPLPTDEATLLALVTDVSSLLRQGRDRVHRGG